MATATEVQSAGVYADTERKTIKRFEVEDIDSIEQTLLTDGAVCLNNIFDADMVSALIRGHDAVLAGLDAKMVGLDRKEATYLNGFDDHGHKQYEKQGYWSLSDGTKVLDVGKGRLDFTYGLDHGVFAEPKFHSPPALSAILSRMLKADYTHYIGAVPSRTRSENGFLHRDTYSLFDDEALDASLPAFYYTVLMPLCDITEELGPTEIHLGSHRCGLRAGKECPTAAGYPLKAGDALIFDGRCLHRGLANQSSNLRRVLYAVWHKKWYNDYSEFNFAPEYSVCQEEPPQKRVKL